MAFREFALPSGRIAIVGSRRNTRREGAATCQECGVSASFLCDYVTEQRRPFVVMCDRALCGMCRRKQAPRTSERDAIDYCPAHDLIAHAEVAVAEDDTNEAWGLTSSRAAGATPARHR